MKDQAEKTAPESAADDLPIWDSLEHVYLNLKALSLAPGDLGQFFRDKALLARLPDLAGMNAMATTLRQDVETFNEQLEAIHATHTGKTGDAADGDDHMLAIQTYEQYLSWEARYRSVVIPNVFSITQTFQNLPPAANDDVPVDPALTEAVGSDAAEAVSNA